MNSKFNFNSIKPYLLPIIAVVVVVVLFPLVILPWFGNVKTGWANIGTQKTKLAALQTKADALDRVNAAENKKILEDQVDPAIPSESDPAGALGTIQQVATTAGVSTKSASYGSGSAAGAAAASTTTGGSVSASISVGGNYASIFNFISQSETVARVLSLSNMHIVPESEGNGDQLVATFDIVAPYQPAPTNLGPTEDPLPELTGAKTKTLSEVNKLHPASYAATPADSITGKPSPF